MVFPISSLWGFCPYTFLRFLLSFSRSRVGRQLQVINLVGQCRWTTYCANLIRVHTFRSGSKLFGRAANFSVRPQTFRSGSKLFCQAADCSVVHQTFRSRIKLSGRASNFSVRLCSLYNLPQAANVLQVPSVGIFIILFTCSSFSVSLEVGRGADIK